MNITIIDANSLYSITKIHEKTKTNYENLKLVCEIVRNENGMNPSDRTDIYMYRDPSNMDQQRFVTYLNKINMNPTQFNINRGYITPPLDFKEKDYTSMVPKIAYALGLLSKYETANILIISHSSELLDFIYDLDKRLTKGKLGIAFFHSLLKKNKKDFINLDPYSKEILGIDLQPCEQIEEFKFEF